MQEASGLRRSARLQNKAASQAAQDTQAAGSADCETCCSGKHQYRSLPLDVARSAGPAVPTSAARKRRAAGGAGSKALASAKKMRLAPMLTGYWDLLPAELFDAIIDLCTPRQMAVLETSCRYFRHTVDLQGVCQRRLREISRAKALEPCSRAGEKWTALLHFINAQSAAAAQATALAFGGFHTAALLVEVDAQGYRDHPHSLYTWGRGFNGQLGHGDNDDLQHPKPLCLGYQPCTELPNMEEEITAAVVACGGDHTATISRRGQLFTWGLGNSGELGHLDAPFVDIPSPRRAYLFNHDHIRIVSVACGGSHTLAIAENGTLWSCGRNRCGQLGNGSIEDCNALTRVLNLPRGLRIVSAGAGALHSMALASDGSLFTWGDARYGQLGHAHLQSHLQLPGHNPMQRLPLKIAALNPTMLQPANRVTAISCGGWHAMAVTVGGSVLAFGRNHHGQLGTGDKTNRWQPTDVPFVPENDLLFHRSAQVACGASHSLVLVAQKGRLTACSTGFNYFGQLGLGHTSDCLRFTPIPGIRDPVALVAGEHNSGAIMASGSVYVWGRNDWCQLGLGDDKSRWAPQELEGYKAVHPDRTLRKSKRSAPRMRRVARAGSVEEEPPAQATASCPAQVKGGSAAQRPSPEQ